MLDETSAGVFEGTVTFVAGNSNLANRELHVETGFNGDVITATYITNGATATIFPIDIDRFSGTGKEITGDYSYSSIARFEINDPNANSDELVEETVTIDITSSIETITISLKENGPNSGIFSEDISNVGSFAEIMFMSGPNLLPTSGDVVITQDYSTTPPASAPASPVQVVITLFPAVAIWGAADAPPNPTSVIVKESPLSVLLAYFIVVPCCHTT